MARHGRFNLEFKRQVVLDFLEKRMGLRELAREHSVSRNLLSQWVRKYETIENDCGKQLIAEHFTQSIKLLLEVMMKLARS
jgi:transposase-like protein